MFLYVTKYTFLNLAGFYVINKFTLVNKTIIIFNLHFEFFKLGNTTKQVCPYAIHVFDLTTDTFLRKYTLRPEDTNANTFIANIAIDIGSKGCEDTFLYASDELGYGLISYSWELNTSWRHTHSFLMPDPLAGDYNIGGKY